MRNTAKMMVDIGRIFDELEHSIEVNQKMSSLKDEFRELDPEGRQDYLINECVFLREKLNQKTIQVESLKDSLEKLRRKNEFYKASRLHRYASKIDNFRKNIGL